MGLFVMRTTSYGRRNPFFFFELDNPLLLSEVVPIHVLDVRWRAFFLPYFFLSFGLALTVLFISSWADVFLGICFNDWAPKCCTAIFCTFPHFTQQIGYFLPSSSARFTQQEHYILHSFSACITLLFYPSGWTETVCMWECMCACM